MVGKYKVVTLCGSARFKEDFIRAQEMLTLQGCIVLSLGVFDVDGEACEESVKEMLGDMHKRRIDMADEIYVVNKNGYIGASTRSEIEYAKARKIPIIYMERPLNEA